MAAQPRHPSEPPFKTEWPEIVDRICRGDAIHAYSPAASEREWVLPEDFRGRPLEVFTLTKDGRGPAPRFNLEGGKIRLELAPRTPVKIRR